MELLGDVGHVESRLVKLDIVFLSRCKIGPQYALNLP
jgi:hypothetical protein